MGSSPSQLVQDALTAVDSAMGARQNGTQQPWADTPAIYLPWEQTKLFDMLALDLSTLANEAMQPVGDSYEIEYLGVGSTPGGVLMVNDIPFFPGQRIRAYFRSLRVRRGNANDPGNLASVLAGTALLILHKVPGLEYRETAEDVVSGTSYTSLQNLTGSAPTLATDGFPISRARGIRVSVGATGANTLSGAGTLLAYYYSPGAAKWFRNSDLDLTIPAAAAGLSGWTFGDIVTPVGVGRAQWVPSAVTVSGGTQVNVYEDVG